MKKVVRLTESELTNIVKKVINETELVYYKRRIRMINIWLDEMISEAKGYGGANYETYKSNIKWDVLGRFEELYGDVRDIEEFFEFMNIFDDKIKEGYMESM